MYVLGVNRHHDGAACLLQDGKIVVAIEAERLRRIKHVEVDCDDDIINYCLGAAGISLTDVDLVVLNSADSERFRRIPRNENSLVISHHLAHAYGTFAQSGFDTAAILIVDGSGNRFDNVEPCFRGDEEVPAHFEEAYSCFIGSGSEISVLEKAWGEWDHESVPRLSRFPSLGHMYSMVSEYIFRHWSDAGKVMGLAPYGSGERFRNLRIVSFGKNGELLISTNWVDQLPFGNGWSNPESVALFKDLAWKVQDELERALIFLVRHLYEKTKTSYLCIGGGVGLNCVANQKLLDVTPFQSIFIQPAAGDAGVAIGCAYYGYWRRLKERGIAASRSRHTRQIMHSYLGRSYDEDEISALLASYAKGSLSLSIFQPLMDPVLMRTRYRIGNGPWEIIPMQYDATARRFSAKIPFLPHTRLSWVFEITDNNERVKQVLTAVGQEPWQVVPRPIAFRRLVDPSIEAARLLADGAVLGWFQGGSEFGPRALGHRSILADPCDPRNLDRVNLLKGRELFRPLAPIVPVEFAHEYFDLSCESPFMLLTFPVHTGRRQVIPAVTHVDGSARLQTVRKEINPQIHLLLLEFKKLIGVPVLINTSFNGRAEPIVETPVDALCTFLRMGLDGLVMGNWLITNA